MVDGYFRDLARVDRDADHLTRMAYSELRLRLPELLLMRVDKISMSTSNEGRVPFLDHDLVETSDEKHVFIKRVLDTSHKSLGVDYLSSLTIKEIQEELDSNQVLI